MAITTQITIGNVQVLTQNQVFALPARQVRVLSSLAIDVSLDGSTWGALANATTGADCTAAFVRCTTGNANFVCKV